MGFDIIGEITDIETIAVGSRIRDVKRLRKHYGKGRWRKLKGIARIRLANGVSGWQNFIDRGARHREERNQAQTLSGLKI
jgi:hypothetical protein